MPERLHGGGAGRPFNPDEYTVEEVNEMLQNAFSDLFEFVGYVSEDDGSSDFYETIIVTRLLTNSLVKRAK